MIHLWVDPIYGDDATGNGPNDVQSYFNPGGNGLDCGVAVNAPHSVLDPAQGNAALLHAPHPFRTITAAIAYVNRLRSGPTGPPPLPHTDPVTNRTWAYCIIHLLPGWYGPSVSVQMNGTPPSTSLSTATDTHKDNALVPNGDVFPLHLPPRVSLKGTNVLNTVIDLGGLGTAIEFGRVINGVPMDGTGSFVDSITFYSCGIASDPQARGHAAILIDDEVASRPTITNCVFAVNMIGVLVNASEEPVPAVVHDGTTIMSCTFAWNGIGVWNGQIDLPDPINDIAVGFSRLNLINNIIDGSAPNGGTVLMLPCNLGSPDLPRSWPNNRMGLQVASAFEGVSKEDMQVLINGEPVDTNAYESGIDMNGMTDRNYNRRTLPPPPGAGNIPLTDPRVAGTFDPDESRNIAFITGHPNQQANPPTVRGILFVNDLICHGRAAGFFTGTGNAGFDGSMLDFRLSPAVAPASATNNQPSQLNPLVDAGFRGPFPATMANGLTIADPPGYLPLNSRSQPFWQHHNLETDGEGHGNPRVHDHPVYPNVGPSAIDIGADELSDLIVAGYRVGTTTFLGLDATHVDNPTMNLPSTPAVALDNTRLWYLGPPTALHSVPGNTVPQPSYRTYATLASTPAYPAAYLPWTWASSEAVPGGASRPWYAIRNNLSSSIRRQPAPLRPACTCSNCSSPPPTPQPLLTVTDLGNAYRATLADVTPHLLPDVHPWWSPMGAVLFGTAVHVMAPSFHLWQNCNGTSLCDPLVSWQPNPLGQYNFYLYQHPLAATANPPGSALGMTDINTGKTFRWLDGRNETMLDPPQAVTFGTWQGASAFSISDFDAWCLGGTGTGTGTSREVVFLSTRDPSAPPDTEITALRFTLEWADDEPLWLPPNEPEIVKNIQSFLVVVE